MKAEAELAGMRSKMLEKVRNAVLQVMDILSKTMNCVSKMTNFVLQMTDFALNMTDFGADAAEGARAERYGPGEGEAGASGGTCRCCLLCIYMPAIDRSLSDCSLSDFSLSDYRC